jgi:outer membrane protein TolC
MFKIKTTVLIFVASLNLFAGESIKISLDRAVEMALQNNYSLKSAKYDFDAVHWQMRGAYSTILPKVQVNSSFTKLDGETVRRANIFTDVGRNLVKQFDPTADPNDIRPSAYNNNYETSISVIQPIYNGGAELAAISASRSLKKATNYNYEESKQNIILNVKKTYYNVLKMQELVKISEKSLSAIRERLENAKKLYSVGKQSQADVLRWEVEVANGEGNLLSAQNGLAVTQMVFKDVIGADFQQDFELVPLPDSLITLNSDNSKNLLLASKTEQFGFQTENIEFQSIDAHPALLSMRFNLEAQKANVRLAWGNFQPRINLIYNYGWEKNNTIGLDSFKSWNLTISLSYPIFNSFGDYMNVQKIYSEMRKLQSTEATLKRGLTVQLTNASLNLKLAESKINIAKKGLNAAEENLRIVTNMYNLGMISNINFIDAQTAHNSAKVNYINAIYDYYIAQAEYEKAKGTIKQ